MAIDENLIGEVRPSESAVDRLRKRNRIRPWESNLIGEQTKSKSESEGVGKPPPGQPTQRANEPEGKNPEVEPPGKGVPVGISPTGSATHEVQNPVGETTTAQETKTVSPLGNLPSGTPAQRVNHPLGAGDVRACGSVPQAFIETPTGLGTQRVNHPGGKLPSGSRAQGNTPTGSNAPEAGHPVGESTPLSEAAMYPTQGVSDPGGSSPSGQDSLEPRNEPMNGFDPTPFVPADKGAVFWREKGSGEIRIPHRLYEFAHRATSTRNELLVFDCLLRFSLGFHRSWCEAGYSFIAAWTGINDITNIKKSLRTLISAGIVVKAKEHNSASNCGSIYELPVVKGYLEYVAARKERLPGEKTEKEPLGVLPSGYPAPGSVAPPAGGQEAYRPVGDLPPKKENSNKRSKKTLSSELPPTLQTYIEQIKAPAKRDSELFFLAKLNEGHGFDEIAKAVQYVQQNGTLGNRDRCHSPLKYLAITISEVLAKVTEEERRFSPSGGTTTETERAEDTRGMQALHDFDTQLTDSERAKYLELAAQENSFKEFTPPPGVMRILAAARWKRELSEKLAG